MRKKILVLLVFLAVFIQLHGQETRISYQTSEKSLTQILKDLEKKYDIYFSFSPSQIKGKKAAINAENESLLDFLSRLLRPLQLEHALLEDKFISVKTPESVYISAEIIDQESGESLPFTTVRLKDTFLGTVSDVDGKVKLFVDQPLDAVLVFSFLGYEDKEIPVEEIDTSQPLRIELTPEATMLDKVVVKEYINRGVTTNEVTSSITIDPSELEVLPGLSEADPLLSAQILPGVNSNDESAAGLNVRGSARDHTYIYFDELPIYYSGHYFGNISAFIPSTVGGMDVYKNVIPANYGGASAGLVQINSRSLQLSKPLFEAGFNMTHGDIFGLIPFSEGNGSVMFSARRSYNDFFTTPTFDSFSNKIFDGSPSQNPIEPDEDYQLDFDSKLRFSDFTLRGEYAINNSHQIGITGLRSRSRLKFNSTDEEGNRTTQNHAVLSQGVAFSWVPTWSPQFESKLSYALVDYSLSYDLTNFRTEEDETDNDTAVRTNDLFNHEVKFQTTWSPNSNRQFTVGYQFNSVDAKLTNQELYFLEQDDIDTLGSQAPIHAVFGSYEANHGKWRYTVAGRFTSFEQANSNTFDPQVQLAYDASNALTLKASFGQYHQFLSTEKETEFTLTNAVEQRWILANAEENIPILRNRQLSGGFTYNSRGWLIDFDAFYKRFNGLLARNMGVAFNELGEISTGEEQIFGLELLVRKRWEHLRLWASYTFNDSEASFIGETLSGAPTESNFPSTLNIRHQLQLSATYSWGQFEASIGWTYKTGLPFTDQRGIQGFFEDGGGEDDDDDDDEEEEEEEEEFDYYDVLYGDTNAGRLEAYHRLDASFWYRFPKKNNGKWSGLLGISFINIYDRDNVFNRSFSPAESELDDDVIIVEGRDRLLLGFTPNLSLRINF